MNQHKTIRPSKRKKTFFFLLLAVVLIGAAAVFILSGRRGTGGAFPDGEPAPVAERVTVDGNEMIVIPDIRALKSTLDIDLSEWCEPLEIVRLDNRTEALVSRGNVVLSEHYIGLLSNEPVSFKLFDRRGNYLRNIGFHGRANTEYAGIIEHAVIDEANDRIYLVFWGGNRILRFGIDGTIYPPIPFPQMNGQTMGLFKGNLRLEPDGTFIVSGTPNPQNGGVWIWRQDAEGNLLRAIARLPEGTYVDYSSNSMLGPDTEHYEPFLAIYKKPYTDTLYRYEPAAERWTPRFTVGNLDEIYPSMPSYDYAELPDVFIGSYSTGETRVGPISWRSTPPFNFFVGKESLKGAYFRLKIGELGGLEAEDPTYYFRNGHFLYNLPAITLKKQLKELLDAAEMDAATEQRVRELYDVINEDDNNILLVAKLKK
jgi:hypothetical protein